MEALADIFENPLSLEELAKAANQGVPRKVLDELSQALGVGPYDLAPLVHISERTLRRYKPDQLFPPETSERLLQIARVFERAIEVFDLPDRAAKWMGRQNRALGTSPLNALTTAFGAERVLQVLGRIEHGVFS